MHFVWAKRYLLLLNIEQKVVEAEAWDREEVNSQVLGILLKWVLLLGYIKVLNMDLI